jgi:hypothetical protein
MMTFEEFKVSEEGYNCLEYFGCWIEAYHYYTDTI